MSPLPEDLTRVNLQPDLSVIVPFYNEQDNLLRDHAAIAASPDPLGIPFHPRD